MSPSRISLVELQDATLDALSNIRDEAVGLFESPQSPPTRPDYTLRLLFRYLMERCQTVSFLVSHRYAWDAEIILRSFYETAAKFLFIAYSPESSKHQLVDEFWDDLGVATNRKQSRKAMFNMALHHTQEDEIETAIFKAFQDEERFKVSSDKSKRERKAIEQKWSFSGMMDSLNELLPSKAKIDSRVLLHSYGIASHLLHADHRALDLILDRSTRERSELKLLEAAQACRIFSDQVNLCFLCVIALKHHRRAELKDVKKLVTSVQQVSKLAEPHFDAFYESQRELYGLDKAPDEAAPSKS